MRQAKGRWYNHEYYILLVSCPRMADESLHVDKLTLLVPVKRVVIPPSATRIIR
jgi:hypothetical protein